MTENNEIVIRVVEGISDDDNNNSHKKGYVPIIILTILIIIYIVASFILYKHYNKKNEEKKKNRMAMEKIMTDALVEQSNINHKLDTIINHMSITSKKKIGYINYNDREPKKMPDLIKKKVTKKDDGESSRSSDKNINTVDINANSNEKIFEHKK
jgi:hypothetical protein